MAETNNTINVLGINISKTYPYLEESDIHHLKLSDLYRILGSVNASNDEVEQIKQTRRRLQKLHYKQKRDGCLKDENNVMSHNLSEMLSLKEELYQEREELKSEISQYRERLHL